MMLGKILVIFINGNMQKTLNKGIYNVNIMLEVFMNIKELYLEVTNEDFDSF